MRFPYAASLFAVLLAPTAAHAIPPDFDGERGFEGWLTAGYGGFTANSVRQFEPASDAAVGTPPEAFTGGFNGRVGVGFRPMPLFSIGATASLQTLSSDPVTLAGASFPTGAGAFSAGVYGRFYPMPLFTGSLHERRVRFDGWSLRRLDPWVSLGVEYAGLWRTESDASLPPPSLGASWNRSALAIPIAVGFDVRVLPALAVGIHFGLAPTITTSSDRATTFVDGSFNVHTTSMSFDPADAVNVAWDVGLGVRYTLTP